MWRERQASHSRTLIVCVPFRIHGFNVFDSVLVDKSNCVHALPSNIDGFCHKIILLNQIVTLSPAGKRNPGPAISGTGFLRYVMIGYYLYSFSLLNLPVQRALIVCFGSASSFNSNSIVYLPSPASLMVIVPSVAGAPPAS